MFIEYKSFRDVDSSPLVSAHNSTVSLEQVLRPPWQNLQLLLLKTETAGSEAGDDRVEVKEVVRSEVRLDGIEVYRDAGSIHRVWKGGRVGRAKREAVTRETERLEVKG